MVYWLVGLGCLWIGVGIGMVAATLLAEGNAERWYQRLAARQGCPVCAKREYDDNSKDATDMNAYRERHGKKRIR